MTRKRRWSGRPYHRAILDTLGAEATKQVDELKARIAQLSAMLEPGRAELHARIAELEAQVRGHEDREAKVCPEDVSFEEVIAKLTAERDAAIKRAEEAEKREEGLRDVISLALRERMAREARHE